MIAAPIVAALMLVAVGGGALDEGIVGVPDSLVRWWKGSRVHRRRILHFSEDVNGVSKNTRKITHKRSGLELAFEQLEMHAQRARHQRLQAEQAAASMAIVRPMDKPSSRPGSPTPSPRVIGTRRRRSRGNSDLEMRSF